MPERKMRAAALAIMQVYRSPHGMRLLSIARARLRRLTQTEQRTAWRYFMRLAGADKHLSYQVGYRLMPTIEVRGRAALPKPRRPVATSRFNPDGWPHCAPVTVVLLTEPVPKARARVRLPEPGEKARSYTPPTTRQAEREIGELWKQQVRGPYPRWPREIPLTVRITAYLPRPVKPTRGYPSKSDVDNLGKCLCDALNLIAWQDDQQITDLQIRKRYGAPRWLVYVGETMQRLTEEESDGKAT